MSDPKPRLYIDVDDTIIAEHYAGTGYDLRPGVATQLRGLARLFDCFWLTHWTKEDLYEMWRFLYRGRLMTEISYMNWKAVDPNNKATAVIAGPPNFWWLEDTLSTGKLTSLDHAGLLDRFIPVPPKGPWGFCQALKVLFEKAKIGEKELDQVGAKIGWFSKGLPDVDRFEELEQGTFASGFVTNGKQHCGDCIHRPGEKPFCNHPLVLEDPELQSLRTDVDGVSLVKIDGDRDCCTFINKGK